MNITDNLSQDTIYKQGTANLTFGRQRVDYSVPSYPQDISVSPFSKPAAPAKQSFLPPVPSRRAFNENETPVEQPVSYDVDSAHAVVDHAFDNVPQQGGAMSGDSKAGDQDKIKNDLNKVATSSNPDEAAAELQNKPFYKQNSFYSGLINTGLAIMSGANPLDAAKAGIEAQQQQKGQDDIAAQKAQMASQRDQLIQRYDERSVDMAIKAGDPSLLRDKQLTQEEQRQQQLADRDEARQYAQSTHDRDRSEQLEDAKAKAGVSGADWAMNAKGIMYNKRTGETKGALSGDGSTASLGADSKFGLPKVQLANGDSVYVDTNQKPTKQGSEAYYMGKDEQGNPVKVPANTLVGANSSSTDAGNALLDKDLDTIINAPEDEANNITGYTGDVGEMAMGSNLSTNIGGGKTGRLVYQSAKRIQGAMRNRGIADAKAMGASGINTEAEAKMYFEGMPQLDFSGYQEMVDSAKAIKEYNAQFKGKKASQGALSSTNANQEQPESSGYNIHQ